MKSLIAKVKKNARLKFKNVRFIQVLDSRSFAFNIEQKKTFGNSLGYITKDAGRPWVLNTHGYQITLAELEEVTEFMRVADQMTCQTPERKF